MENIATKKFTYDHAASYKSRGKLGASNRVVRAQRASEKRHVSRMDEISKRRRMPLSSLADENVVDHDAVKETNDTAKESATQPELSRRERLMKWREERQYKKVTGSEKKSFVVGHVKYDKEASLFALKTNPADKGGVKSTKVNKETSNTTKRVTRASARLAKQSNSAASKPGSLSVKQIGVKPKDSGKQNDKAEANQGKSGRITRQSTRAKPSACQSLKEAPKPKKQVKTRSQTKMATDHSSCQSSSSEPEEHAESSNEKTTEDERVEYPMLDNIKNTVSIGRGCTEGVTRCQMSLGMDMQSFAPADFQFTVPDGMNTFTHYSKTFKFQPLSPNSAAKFMFPLSSSSLFSPEKPTSIFTGSTVESCQPKKQPSVCSNEDGQQSGCEPSKEESPAHDKETCSGSSEEPRCDVEQAEASSVGESKLNRQHPQGPCEPEENMVIEATSKSAEITGKDEVTVIDQEQVGVDNEQHDGAYFRDLVKKETDRLNEICEKWEKINTKEQDIGEEDRGQVRTTIGQAQLLIAQRFHQFSGLIDLSEDKQAEKRATASDLQGFWEMIYFQIEDVDAKFDALEKLKENNWQEEVKKVKKTAKKPKAKKPMSGEDSKAIDKMAAAKSRIQQMRMAMKAKMLADKAKLKAEKRQQEEEAFITILTPVKRSKKDDGTEEVVLTPVRRSNRKTPQKLLLCKNTPVVVTTPKKISDSSPGLRLTPDMTANLHDEQTATCTGMMEADESREEESCGELESCAVAAHFQGDEGGEKVECEVNEESNLTLKSSCKSTATKSRKTPAKVTFQSPVSLGSEDPEGSPEVMSVAGEPAESASVPAGVLGDEGSSGKKTKKSTPRRLSARKCRGRVSTPFNDQGLKRRISEVEKDNDLSTESEERGSSDTASHSDSGASSAADCCPGSGRRRSSRRTPSKYRDSTPQDVPDNEHGKTPSDVSVKLFCEEESKKCEAQKVEVETDAFSKYLRSSSSDEEEEENKEPATIGAVTTSDSKPGRTPQHLLNYLSDLDTPSPTSRQITPMPKTTLFISPSGCTKTPGIGDSLGLISPENVVCPFPAKSDGGAPLVPENVVCQFPAKSDGASLVPLTPVAGKESHDVVGSSSQLPVFRLDDSPVNTSENRRDSVFFAPSYAAAATKKLDNLMSFSPVVEMNAEEQE